MVQHSLRRCLNFVWPSIFVAVFVITLERPTIAWQIDSVTQNVEQQAAHLVRQLGSAEFQVRQNAAKQLWQLGPVIREFLVQAAKQSDAEIAHRAQGILAALNHGIDSREPLVLARLSQFFVESDSEIRGQIVSTFIQGEHYTLAFQLLNQIDTVDDRRLIYQNSIDLLDVLDQLSCQDRWDEIRLILDQPVVMEFDTSCWVYYQLAQGRLPQIQQQWSDRLRARVVDGLKIDSREQLRLIAIHRILDQYDEARQLANDLVDTPLQNRIVQQVLMEQGDWKSISERMLLPGAIPTAVAGKFSLGLAQQTIVHFLNQDREQTQIGLQRFSERTEQMAADGMEVNEAESRQATAILALSILDWPTAWRFVDRERKFELFELLNFLQRPDQAFEAIELGSTLAERQVWFDRRIRQIKSLQEKIVRLENSEQGSDEATEDRNQNWKLCVSVADEIGSLGYTEQAVLFYRMLFDSVRGSDDSFTDRTDVLTGMMELDQPTEVWGLISRGFDPNEYHSLDAFLFPEKQEVARFWLLRFNQQNEAPLRNLQRVAALICSPLAGAESVDIDEELATARSSLSTKNTDFERMVAGVLRFNNRVPEAKLHLASAADRGDQNSQAEVAFQCLQEKDFESAAVLFDQVAKKSEKTVNWMLAAEAFRKLGRSEEAALREVVAFVHWHKGYLNDSVTETLQARDRLSILMDFLRVQICDLDGDLVSNENFRQLLATASQQSAPRQAARALQISLVNSFTNDDQPIGDLLLQAKLARQTLLSQAAADISEGQFEQAVLKLTCCQQFRPGDSEIGEKMIAALDAAGQRKAADELFQQLAEFYLAILKRYPLSPLHHNNYAWICASSQRNLNFALRHCESATANRVFTTSYLDTMAEVQFRLGNTERAIELSRRCIQLNPVKLHYQKQLARFQTK